MATIYDSPAGELDQDALNEAATMDATRSGHYSIFETYYSGRLDVEGQSTDLSDRVRRYLERSGLPFVENFCDVVVDVLAERLSVTGFTCSGSESQDALMEIEGWLDDLWRLCRLDSGQDAVHTTALEMGDAYVIVEYDEERGPLVHFNRPEVIPHISYSDDEPDVVEWASKVWNTSRRSASNADGRPVRRMNIYYPDRVERYFQIASRASGEAVSDWQRWRDGETDDWPERTMRPNGDPRGVPVFHFRPRNLGRDYGRSELAAAIPFQDEITKFVIDLAEIMDYLGWPQRWATGVTEADAVRALPGSIVKAASPEAKFGQFAAADPAGALAAIEGVISRLARRSRIPMHLLTGGTPPSGEALKTAESGLVSKARRYQTPFGDVWESAMRYALFLAVDYGGFELGVSEEELALETQWADPETRNQKDEAETAQIYSELGVSRHTVLSSLGFDPEQEEEWAGREEETMATAAGNMLDGVPPMAPNGQPGMMGDGAAPVASA